MTSALCLVAYTYSCEIINLFWGSEFGITIGQGQSGTIAPVGKNIQPDTVKPVYSDNSVVCSFVLSDVTFQSHFTFFSGGFLHPVFRNPVYSDTKLLSKSISNSTVFTVHSTKFKLFQSNSFKQAVVLLKGVNNMNNIFSTIKNAINRMLYLFCATSCPINTEKFGWALTGLVDASGSFLSIWKLQKWIIMFVTNYNL